MHVAARQLPFPALPVAELSVPVVAPDRSWNPRELAVLLGLTISAVHKRVARENIRTVTVTGRGGAQQRIPLDAMPEDWKTELVRKIPELSPTLASRMAEVARITLGMPEWQRKEVGSWVELIQETWGMKGSALIRRLVELESRFPSLEMSYPTYRRKLSAFLTIGAAGLAPKWGKTRGRSKVDPRHLRVFAQYYLVEGGPDLLAAHRAAYGAAVRENPSLTMAEFGSHMAFKRLLDAHISPSTQLYYRHGSEAWTRTYKSHIQRDVTNLKAGELWVSDHHQLDVGCEWDTELTVIPGVDGEIKALLSRKKKTGKVVFPWITVWRDFRSGKILSCLLHVDAPNSDHVIYSFYLAAVKYGVPEAVLLDNGKDYRCKAFAGGRESTVRVEVTERDRSICRLLGVRVHFAIPYNAKAKPIERDFRKVKEWYGRFMVGYRGGHIKERPERLADEIRRGEIMGFEELAVGLHAFIDTVLNRFPSDGRILRGQSPDEFWDTTEKAVRRVTDEELALCCMRATEPRQIRGNGVRVANLGLDYYADWMSTQGGRRVYLRLDLMHVASAFVFDAETDAYIGRADANVWQAEALVKDEAASERLRALSRMQGQQIKDIKAIGRALDLGVEHLDPVGDMGAALQALGEARGYKPQLTIADARGPEVQASTPLAEAVEADKVARGRKAKRKLLHPGAEAKPAKKRLSLFDCDLEESEEIPGTGNGPEIERATE